MNPKTDKLIRRTTMVGTVVAAYLLLTADYGPKPNALDPIKNAIRSAERSAKEFILGTNKRTEENDAKKTDSTTSKGNP